MSEKKTILFNDLVTNKTRKNIGGKIQKKEKPKAVIKPNTLKKSLLERIKKHQQKEKITNMADIGNNKTTDDMDFHNNFVNSMEYLNKISEKQKKEKKRKKNKTLKNPQEGGNRNNINITMDSLISVDLPNDFDSKSSEPIFLSSFTEQIPPIIKIPVSQARHVSQARPVSESRPVSQTRPVSQARPVYESRHVVPPKALDFNSNEIKILPERPYGCLKGGKKPTFREYHNKTLKHSHSSTSNNKPVKIKSDRQQTLNDLKKSYKKIKLTKRKTRKTTFNLGRSNKTISVLIKNNSTRRKIKREHGLLKQKPLNEIKKHLYDKNLIKIGSTAPNDVLRTLYEQSVLAGDINNVSNDIQLHNFINK